ncbi:protein kinase domain-containing protein [Singulisphaera sp. PoT]|uniref:protein kinase domain-containing protein n=1 Tax=Singulisphaera sp. PoT TaxID=3411797 RepID=UPI003BF5290F
MVEFDAESLAEQAVMIGLVNNEQALEARMDAADGSADALLRSMLRKGLLTSWQIDRLQKSDPTGFFFGGCKVLFHIAEGTFARVYRGVRLTDNKPVAIKVLRQRFVADPAAIIRFNKEAEAGMRLVHPNIVQILDYGEQDKKHYMIMEYVEGSNLRDLLKIRVHIEQKAALPLLIGLGRGLQYSHNSGVTHRDLKATNILISHSGAAKLVDFGLATIEGEEKKTANLNQRTVDYSALERRCASPKGDPRSDIFFLGCVYYQMLSGQPAMQDAESKDMLTKMLKRSLDAIKPLSEQRHAPDEELTRIIEKMMKVELRSRYQTMDEVIKELSAYEALIKNSPNGVLPTKSEARIEDELIFGYRGGQLTATTIPGNTHANGNGTAPEEEAEQAKPKQLLCLEAQPEIRDAFRKTLSKMGYRVILVGDADVAVERFAESTPDVVIFDIDGFGPEGIEQFLGLCEKAKEDEIPLSALVLLAPKQKALRQRIPTNDQIIVLDKPVKMKQIQEAVQQLAPVG